jgi:hypothetical protein
MRRWRTNLKSAKQTSRTPHWSWSWTSIVLPTNAMTATTQTIVVPCGRSIAVSRSIGAPLLSWKYETCWSVVTWVNKTICQEKLKYMLNQPQKCEIRMSWISVNQRIYLATNTWAQTWNVSHHSSRAIATNQRQHNLV